MNKNDDDYIDAEIIATEEGITIEPAKESAWPKGDDSVVRKIIDETPLSRVDKTVGEEEPGRLHRIWIAIKRIF